MGSHDLYGRAVLSAATGGGATQLGVHVDYGSRAPARIDGVVGDIAVEIESRVPKQVRGAVLDLLCHTKPKKLLILLPVHMSNAEDTATQCRNILRRFLDDDNFRVVVLSGSGTRPNLEADHLLVRGALLDLGWALSATE
jgi:hypothetical protein